VLIVTNARDQRRAPTPVEEKLWQALRNRRLAGLRFRRQHLYERFIRDLFCVEQKLAIEVDGDIHTDPAQTIHDQERADFLQSRGIRVLRFSNANVEHHLSDVLRQILTATTIP